ncbi:MAG: hypothetical protein GX113_00485 [Actinobacteria bacterium]|jgi:hypothetical protein|nr:hypothetical protein [Actinomycetota bacterium]
MEKELSSEWVDQRMDERRFARRGFVLHERRTGFDRRLSGSGAMAGTFEQILLGLRDRPRLLWMMLAVVNLLNIADFVLTLNVLASGGAEANPIMRSLFDLGPIWAGAFKLVAVLVATALVWRCRRYRLALVAALVVALVFTAVLFYHAVGLTAIAW